MASREEIADNAAIEDIRAKFGDAEAAKLSADLYKLRRNPPSSNFAGFPRWAIVLIVLWAAALETADKLPRLLLAYPSYQATLAEFQVKMLQPDLTQAQLVKARNEAVASALQPDMTKAQLLRAQNEAKASEWQALLTAAQGLETEGRFLSNGNLSSSYTDKMSSRLARLKP